MQLCRAPVTYPNCLSLASLLVNVVYVKQYGSQRMCFYEGAAPNCEMPGNLSITNGFYPVSRNLSYAISDLHGEAVLAESTTYVVPVNVKTVYVTGGANGSTVVLQNAGISVVGLEPHTLDEVRVTKKGASFTNVTANTFKFTAGIDYTNLRMTNVATRDAIQFVPTTLKRYVPLDGAQFVNVTGNYVALLHHRGTVVADNSKIIWLNQVSGTGSVETKNDGRQLNVALLTGIFGPQYEVEYEAGSIFYQSQEATAIANALVLPTVLCVVVTLFSQGDKLRWKR
jgi:hypothetical protein